MDEIDQTMRLKHKKLVFETKIYHNNSHKIVHVFVAYKPISFATK